MLLPSPLTIVPYVLHRAKVLTSQQTDSAIPRAIAKSLTKATETPEVTISARDNKCQSYGPTIITTFMN